MHDSHKLSNLQRTQTNVPWVIFIFLAVIFFVAHHDLFYSLIEGYAKSADFFENDTIEGSLTRRIAFLSFGLFGAVSLMRQGLTRLKINGSIGWLILFYIFWSFLSIAWSEDIALTFRRLMLFAILCLGALAVSNRFSLRDIIFFVLLSTGFYLLIGIIVEIALGTFRPFAPEYRFCGTLSPNYQGVNCAMLLLSGITAFQSVKRCRILFLACMLIVFVFLILTQSRTSFASVIIVLFAYWTLVKSSSKKIMTLILGVSFTFCLLILLFGDAFFPAMQQVILLGRENSSADTFTGRVPLWNECMKFVAERPVLGYGYNSFWTPRHIRKISRGEGWGIIQGHSVYIDLLLNVGCVGMITFVIIFILGIINSVKYLKDSRNIGYGFLCSLLVFFMLDNILESGLIFLSYQMFLSMVVLARLGFQDPQKKEYI